MPTIRFNLKVPGKLAWLAGFAVLVLVISQGCSKTPMPTSDSTPPTLTWHIHDQNTSSNTQIVGTGTLNAKIGDSFQVTLTADDPQGIHEITLGSTTEWQCFDAADNLAQNHGPSLGNIDKQDLQPDSQGNVLTSIFLIREVNIGSFDCQSGFAFSGGSIVLAGTGTNYFNGITKATLTFKISP